MLAHLKINLSFAAKFGIKFPRYIDNASGIISHAPVPIWQYRIIHLCINDVTSINAKSRISKTYNRSNRYETIRSQY
jgi:hypothetical protein